jgi:8-oxo-dGTP diphosphatase
MNFVCGIMSDGARVALIQKRRPLWMAGRLNGIGGKIEVEETPIEAMAREFGEETGVRLPPDVWALKLILEVNRENTVNFFVVLVPPNLIDALRTTEDEIVMILPLWEALQHPRLMPNLKWIIPLLLDGDSILGTVRVVYEQRMIQESF